jgi:disulfide bond formation protein DsbB
VRAPLVQSATGMSDLWNDVQLFSTFFAMLAILCLVFDLTVIVTAIVAKVRGGLSPNMAYVRDSVGEYALWGAAAVATTAMLGSLYMSEVAKFPPCHLCWLQRYAMYPSAIILLVAAAFRFYRIKYVVLPIVVIGWGISTYHYLLERFPDTVKSPVCGAGDIPCETVWVWKFHFLSIPGMAWVGFLTVFILMLLARPSAGAAAGTGHPEAAATVGGARQEEDPLP